MEHMNMDKPVMGDKSKVCNCHHHKVVPICIMLIGLNVILATLGVYNKSPMIASLVIGALLIVIGGTRLASRKCGCSNK